MNQYMHIGKHTNTNTHTCTHARTRPLEFVYCESIHIAIRSHTHTASRKSQKYGSLCMFQSYNKRFVFIVGAFNSVTLKWIILLL